MWQLIYSRDQGLINDVTGGTTDWYGDPNVNLWAVLVPTAWKQTVTSCCSTSRGSRRWTRRCGRRRPSTGKRSADLLRVVVPVMRPINIIVLVITVIEALRAFDIVWVINKGRNGWS
jgi:multiple sugar transport system permease protein